MPSAPSKEPEVEPEVAPEVEPEVEPEVKHLWVRKKGYIVPGFRDKGSGLRVQGWRFGNKGLKGQEFRVED